MIENDELSSLKHMQIQKRNGRVSSSIFAEVLSSSAGDGDSRRNVRRQRLWHDSANEVIKFRM